MRDYLILAIIVGAAPVCLANPYFGVLMWSWISYFNPHRLAWGIARTFPVALVIAVPTLLGSVFTRRVNRNFFTREVALLLIFWVWIVFTLFHSTQVLVLDDHFAEGKARLIEISKILLMTCLTFLLVDSKKKLKWLLVVTAFSIGIYGIKGAIFGILTGGNFRVWGPQDSFIGDNNDFALALNMTLPMLFFLAQDEENRKWRLLFRIAFFCGAASVLLTYSRGGLLGLSVILAALALKSRHRILSIAMIGVCAFMFLSFAPAPWMERMQAFFGGNLDASAEERLTSWQFAWHLASDFPVTGGGLECFTPELFQRYSSRDPLTYLQGHTSSGPHSIYFQVLGEQGFVGLGIFLSLLASCWFSSRRLRRLVRGKPDLAWIARYSQIVEVSIMAYMVSGAFLGRAYFDLYFQVVAALIILKILCMRHLRELAVVEQEQRFVKQQEAVPVLS
jgi:probable O-glycosylation ligase (exosortase A-associated)